MAARQPSCSNSQAGIRLLSFWDFDAKCFFTTLYFAHTEKEQVRRNQRGKNTSDLIARKYHAFGMAIHSKRQDYDSPKEEKVQRKTHTPGSRDPMLGWAIYSQ